MDIEITKMTSKGQVVIPQDIRKEKGLKEGEKFLVFDINDNIILKRIKNLEKAKTEDEFEKVFRSTWKIAKSRGITKKDVAEEIKAYRKGKNELILSPQILKEFREVISRPKFGFSQEQIINVFKQIVNISTIVMPSVEVNIIKDDPEDNKVLECAETGKVDYIVSGDVHLLNLKQYKGVKIVQSKSILDII